ncbi:MAG TPA: hypothetical protein VFC51_12935 [Chloroflexota bacterium]|nr:hypothetical protein [Chloroflexota bacterium]
MEQIVVSMVPPWALLAALIGVLHGALFHLIFGVRLRQLPFAILIGVLAGTIGAVIGTMIPPAILEIGDTNLIATTTGAWVALGIARLFRFC